MASLFLRPLGRPQLTYKHLLRFTPPRLLAPSSSPRITAIAPPSSSSILLQYLQQQQRRWASGNQSMDLPQGRAQPSMRLQAGESSDMFLRDIGLLPDTFVPPGRKNRPSLFKDPTARLKLIKKRIIYKYKNLLNLAIFRWYAKSPVQLRKPKSLAVGLYTIMYTAFAEGNTGLLRQICCDGLYDAFKSRIQARGPGRMVWTLESVVTRPKIVSNNAITFPDLDTGFRQAVVKIKTLQSITKFDANNRVIPGTGRPIPVVEYLVLQRKRAKNSEGEWMVWGTTEETNLQLLERREKTSWVNQQK